MRIRRVSADRLDKPARQARRRVLSPRERRRLALERQLESAITAANATEGAAFRVELGSEDKVPTVRLAFNRVRERVQAPAVNLLARNGALFIAKRPQSRGRRRAT